MPAASGVRARHVASVEIVRRGFGASNQQRPNGLCLHRNYIFLILQRALNQQKLVLNNCRAIFLKNLRRDDGIRDASLIFHAKKSQEALGRAGALPRNHRSSHAHRHAVAKLEKLARGADALLF